MNENEQKAGSVADQKSKIRERYKGINPDELDVIPALPQEDIFAVENEQRVAVYARVSTDDPRQTSSYELQKNHYHDVISKSPNWKLVQIYADEGISGTSLQHRDQFKLMIEDCKKGQIDLIVTKSVSRFARNVVYCIGHEGKHHLTFGVKGVEPFCFKENTDRMGECEKLPDIADAVHHIPGKT